MRCSTSSRPTPRWPMVWRCSTPITTTWSVRHRHHHHQHRRHARADGHAEGCRRPHRPRPAEVHGRAGGPGRTARTVLESQFEVSGCKNLTTPNVVRNTFEVIEDPRLDAASAKPGTASPTPTCSTALRRLSGRQQDRPTWSRRKAGTSTAPNSRCASTRPSASPIRSHWPRTPARDGKGPAG